MQRLTSTWVVLSAVAGIAGVAAITDSRPSPAAFAQEVPGIIAKSDDFFPDSVGNRWQYRGQISEGPLQIIQHKLFSNVSTVTGTRNLHGTSVTVFHDTNPGNHGPSDSFYRRDAAGIVYYGSEPGSPLEKQLVPYQIVRFPMKVSSSFIQFDRSMVDFGSDVDGDGKDERADVRGEVTIEGQEAISVPAGSYPDAVRVEAKMTLRIHLSSNGRSALGTDVMTAWFARGVGLVKYIERQELAPIKTDRGLVTEVIEELEALDVKSPLAASTGSEAPPEGVFADHPRGHELLEIAFPPGLRAYAR